MRILWRRGRRSIDGIGKVARLCLTLGSGRNPSPIVSTTVIAPNRPCYLQGAGMDEVAITWPEF